MPTWSHTLGTPVASGCYSFPWELLNLTANVTKNTSRGAGGLWQLLKKFDLITETWKRGKNVRSFSVCCQRAHKGLYEVTGCTTPTAPKQFRMIQVSIYLIFQLHSLLFLNTIFLKVSGRKLQGNTSVYEWSVT